MRPLIAFACATWMASSAAAQNGLSATVLNVDVGPSGGIHGVAVGKMVVGNGANQVAYIIRDGRYLTDAEIAAGSAPSSPDTSSLVVFDASDNGGVVQLTRRFQIQTGERMVGFPTMADFDGDSLDEVAFCELADPGSCYVYDADGFDQFTSSQKMG